MARHAKYTDKDMIRIYRRNMQGEDMQSLLNEYNVSYRTFRLNIDRIFRDAGKESPYVNAKRIRDSDIDEIKDESLGRKCSVQLICQERGLPYEMVLNRMRRMGYRIGATDLTHYYPGKYRSCLYCKRDPYCDRIDRAVECECYEFDVVKRLNELRENAQRNCNGKQISEE